MDRIFLLEIPSIYIINNNKSEIKILTTINTITIYINLPIILFKEIESNFSEKKRKEKISNQIHQVKKHITGFAASLSRAFFKGQRSKVLIRTWMWWVGRVVADSWPSCMFGHSGWSRLGLGDWRIGKRKMSLRRIGLQGGGEGLWGLGDWRIFWGDISSD